MKKLLLVALLLCSTLFTRAQVFPGLKASHKKQLLATGLKIPLPTYIPKGFTIDTIITQTGKNVKIEDKILFIQYSRQLPDQTWQSFYVEAGFDGLGSLWYKGERLQSGVGKITMYYQPDEETEEGQKPEKVTDLVGTEWFLVNKTDFHVYCIISSPEEEDTEYEEGDSRKFVPVTRQEFKKILQSLRILQ